MNVTSHNYSRYVGLSICCVLIFQLVIEVFLHTYDVNVGIDYVDDYLHDFEISWQKFNKITNVRYWIVDMGYVALYVAVDTVNFNILCPTMELNVYKFVI